MNRFGTIMTVTMLATVLMAAGPGQAAPIVENFSGYTVGTNLTSGTGGWGTVNASNTQGYVAVDPVDSGNQVGYFRRTGNPATGGRYLNLGSNDIADGTVGEFSVRFLFNQMPNSAFGLSMLSDPGPASGSGAGKELHVDFRLGNAGGLGTLQYMTDQGTSQGPMLASSLVSNTWYTLSATIDNASNTVSNIYLQGGDYATKTLVGAGPYSFNVWADSTYGQATDLKTFFVFEQGYTAGVYLDNISVPEPATMGLLALGGLGAMIRRRRTAK